MNTLSRSMLYFMILIGISIQPIIANAKTITMPSVPTVKFTYLTREALGQQGCQEVRASLKRVGSGENFAVSWTYPDNHSDILVSPRDSFLDFATKDYVPQNFSKVRLWSCPPEKVVAITAKSAELEPQPSWDIRFLNNAVNFIFWALNYVIGFLMSIITKILLPLITEGSFIQNSIVKGGWPFIQGITNLGFIFVLLYIALATTLRMESVSTSVQRLLPRLLIGALLVNFSLIIGGIIIDASRLVMAVEMKLIAGQDVNGANLAEKILHASGAYEATALSLIASPDLSTAWNSLASNIVTNVRTSLFNALITIGLGIIAINLFVRYIALLILLIFSPMAYLAMILPQTKDFASKWWSNFIKWVLYGPLILFFLTLIIKIQSIGLTSAPKDTPDAIFIQQLVHLFIVIALLFIGHKVSKQVAGAGSSAVMNFAAKHPRSTAALAGTVLTGGAGGAVLGLLGMGAAQMARTGARNAGRDIYNAAGANLKNAPGVKGVRDFMGYGLRDDKGNIKPGKSSWASRGANALTERFNSSMQKDIANTKALGTISSEDALKDVALLPSQLGKGHVADALGETNIKFIMENGSQAQRMSLAKNKDYIAGLRPGDMQKLQQTILNSVHQEATKAGPGAWGAPNSITPGKAAKGISDSDKTKLIEQISKTVEDIKK